MYVLLPVSPFIPLHDPPDDFFVGIGDINSTFLPKIDPSTPAPISLPSSSSETKPPPSEDVTTTSDASTSDVPVPSVVNGDESAAAETAEQTVLVLQNNAALDAQLEERPLAKAEKELQEHEEEDAEQTPTPADNITTSPSPTPESDKENKDHKDDHHHHRKALLKNDDVELDRVGKVIVHPPICNPPTHPLPLPIAPRCSPPALLYDPRCPR
jgi:RNA polymerase II subunit A-like phosphatase